MGAVYLAEHLRLRTKVAIKLLLKPDEGVHVQRFWQEARAAATIQHEHIVSVMDTGKTPDGRPFFVMEYLEGEDLGRALARAGRFSWRTTRRIMRQILVALRVAHRRGVIHRDLKPENCVVRLDEAGKERIKLLDFGVAKLIQEDPSYSSLTKTGIILGTPRYMAPEQVRADGVDARVDLYAAGVIMFELLTGAPPFDGPSPVAVLTQHITQRPPRLRDVYPALEVPEGVEELVARALKKRPEDRIQSADEFLAALRDPSRLRRSAARRVAVASLVAIASLLASLLVARACAGEDTATRDAAVPAAPARSAPAGPAS
ncbi:MAG: serine/threonine protein kinase [Myxococcales bacterium]|nr:serine/threonine protein kinase [Myxococcales bacterium]